MNNPTAKQPREAATSSRLTITQHVVVCLLACAAATQIPASENLLANPSFEQGREGWMSLAGPGNANWHEFSIAPDPEGAPGRCALLELNSAEAKKPTGIWGVIQEVKATGRIPRYLRGRYFVADWKRGVPRQYIQVVFNLWPTEKRNLTRDEVTPETVPVQLAFVLSGISEPPFRITNRRFVFAGPGEPQTGEWIDFEFDLHDAFTEHWGSLPAKLNAFRVLCEVRFDGRSDTDKDARATVYFDDIYLGDERGTTPSPARAVAAFAEAKSI